MSNQEQMLVKLYKGMSSAEIRSRLAGTGLIALARGVAENELQQRVARAAATGADTADQPPMQARDKPSDAVVAFRLSLMAVIVLSLLAGSALLLPKLAPLIWAGTIFALAMLIGKAFPLFGKIVGGLLLASPLAIFGVIIHNHRASDWGPGEVMLIYLVGLVYSAIAAAVGAVLYGAANKQG